MTRTALSVLIIALSASAGIADPVALKDTVPHLTTTGHAWAEVVPDTAELSLGVSNERTSADDATAATVKVANDIVADMKASGVEASDIRTSFSLAAQYDQKLDGQGHAVGRRLRGYLASEDLRVRVHDTGKAGALARNLIGKGANNFRGIDYSFSGEAQKRDELKATAIRDAKAAAKIYTDAIGLSLGRVLQIGDEAGGGSAPLPGRMRMPLAAPATAIQIPVEPGLQRFDEDITVIWEIAGTAK